jgi:hypothetical protein
MSQAASPTWTAQGAKVITGGGTGIGPSNYVAGALEEVVVHPGDANTIYVGGGDKAPPSIKVHSFGVDGITAP